MFSVFSRVIDWFFFGIRADLGIVCWFQWDWYLWCEWSFLAAFRYEIFIIVLICSLGWSTSTFICRPWAISTRFLLIRAIDWWASFRNRLWSVLSWDSTITFLAASFTLTARVIIAIVSKFWPSDLTSVSCYYSSQFVRVFPAKTVCFVEIFQDPTLFSFLFPGCLSCSKVLVIFSAVALDVVCFLFPILLTWIKSEALDCSFPVVVLWFCCHHWCFSTLINLWFLLYFEKVFWLYLPAFWLYSTFCCFIPWDRHYLIIFVALSWVGSAVLLI